MENIKMPNNLLKRLKRLWIGAKNLIGFHRFLEPIHTLHKIFKSLFRHYNAYSLWHGSPVSLYLTFYTVLCLLYDSIFSLISQALLILCFKLNHSPVILSSLGKQNTCLSLNLQFLTEQVFAIFLKFYICSMNKREC